MDEGDGVGFEVGLTLDSECRVVVFRVFRVCMSCGSVVMVMRVGQVVAN